MFEVTYKITALAESDGQGQRVFRVMKQADPVDEDGFLSLVTMVYEQDVYRTLRVGDDLTVLVHLDLPPREIEKTLRFRGDGQFEGEGEAAPTTDLLSLIATMFGYHRQHVQPGDVLTVSFRLQRP
jgi:hypothetical protein